MKPVLPQLQAGRPKLLDLQGFHGMALVRSKALPLRVSGHPAIRSLGEGTFLMVALSCHRNEPEDLSTAEDPHALIAPFARRDYYGEAVARLKTVVRTLCAEHGLSRRSFRIFCNSPLPEKQLAVASGLGSPGKNSLILIPGLGSLFVLAGIFFPSDVAEVLAVGAANWGSGSEAAADTPVDSAFPLCGSCRICQDACPVGALRRAGLLDAGRCLQALCTRPVSLPPATRRAWAVRFYGCQTCQDVCPHNRDLDLLTVTRRGELGASLSLRRLLTLSEAGIKELVRGSALARSWIPPRTLLRNALLAAGNRRHPLLSQLVARHRSSPDPLISRAAVWALGRIEDTAGGLS